MTFEHTAATGLDTAATVIPAVSTATSEPTIMVSNNRTPATFTAGTSAAQAPYINAIVPGKVLTILRDDKTKQPYGVLLQFGGYKGRLLARELDHRTVYKNERLSQVKVGDEFSVMVTGIISNNGQTNIQLSERQATEFNQLRDSLENTKVQGTVSHITKYGAFISIGVGRDAMALLALVHVEELSSADQRQRLAGLQIGDSMTVIVNTVQLHPSIAGKVVIAASEIDAQLRSISANPTTVHAGVITGTGKDGINIILHDGIEAILPFDKIGDTNVDGLAKGNKVKVNVVGIQGRALIVSRENFNSARDRALKDARRAEKRGRDADLRRQMQSTGGKASKKG